MALTQGQVSQLYVALFGRASEGAGNKGWIDRGLNQVETAKEMIASDDAKDYFGGELKNLDFVTFIYENTLGFTHDKEGIANWTAKLDAGISRGELVVDMITAALSPEFKGSAPQNQLLNRIEVSNYMATNVEKVAPENVASTQFVSARYPDAGLDVTDSASTLTAAEKIIDEMKDAPVPVPGEEYSLEVTQDKLTGTAKDDKFIADVVQNQNGAQVNTLGSGDIINGGAGNDTLDATLIAAYNVAGKAMDITPTIKNVENIIINAQISDNGTLEDEVVLNARKMNGVEKISSKYSDADLLVKNMTTNGVTGGTAAQTVEFAYSGNKDTHWDEANMTVYYDQDYLVREVNNESTLEYYYQDIDAGRDSGNAFSAQSSYRGIQFVNPADGKPVKLELTNDEYATFAATIATTTVLQQYTNFADLLNTKLAALNLGDGWEIKVDSSIYRTNDRKEGQTTFNQLPVNDYAIILQAPEGTVLDLATSANITSSVVDPNKNEFNRVQESGSSDNTPVAINVDLEKVGLAGHGGSLVIGSMNKTTTNTFDAKDSTTDTVAGFEVFNVDVNGAADKASSLSALHSTNNTLRKVEIVSEDRSAEKVKTNADLTIGNTNTGATFGTVAGNAQALKDVQVFDASAFKGNLTLNAGITSEIVAKYLDSDLNLNGDLAFTNEIAQFTYNAGSGNDKLNIAIDGATINQNLAAFTQAVGAAAVAGMPEFDLTTSDANAVAGGTPVKVYFNGTNYVTATGYVVSTYTDATSGETYLVYNNAGAINYLFGYTTAAGFTAGPVVANAPVLKDDVLNPGTDIAVVPADLATFNPNASTVALDIVYTNIVAGLADTNGVNLFDLDINGNDGNDEIVVTVEGQVTIAPLVTVSTASNITINGGKGNDLIDISANDTDWTFTVEFTGTNFGTDTIVGFNAGTVAISNEKQVLDLSGFEAHAGETIYVTVGDKQTSFTASAFMNKTAIDAKVLEMLVKPATGETVTQQFDASSTLTSLNGVDKNIQSVTVEVKKGDIVKNSADSVTHTQGGIHNSLTPSQGADVLDFTAYGAKGIKTVEYTLNADPALAASYTETVKKAASATTEKTLVLIESIHKQGLYDVYESIDSRSTIDTLASGNKVGSIDLSDTGVDAALGLDATQFLLV